MVDGYSVYDLETGEIVRTVLHLNNAIVNCEVGQGVFEGRYNDALYYIKGNTVKARPSFTPVPVREIRADGLHETTISALPVGTVMRFDGAEETIDDGSFIFSTAVPGAYQFEFAGPFPYRRQIVTVIAHAP